VTLHVSEQLHLDKKMELGGVSEIVEVLETAPLVETTGMDIRDTLGSRAVTQLPIGRRDFTDLLLLSTGSANSTNLRLGETASMSVEGSRPGSNNFVLDGIDNNRAGFAGIEIRQLPFDTIQEVSISFDNQAEVGLNSGALINVVSRSGTNEPHGSVYYFNRNRQIAASDFFESENSPLLWHQFGLTAGGPLARDRAFVLGGYEGTRELRARVRLTSVPSSSRLAAARSIIAANSLTENPLSTRLLQFFPSPDRPGPFNNRDINSPLAAC